MSRKHPHCQNASNPQKLMEVLATQANKYVIFISIKPNSKLELILSLTGLKQPALNYTPEALKGKVM